MPNVTLDALFSLTRLGPGRLSPDRRHIALALTTADRERNTYQSRIVLVDAETGAVRPFTAGPLDSEPAWSPDGRRLAFLSRREGDEEPQVYVMPVDGGEAARVSRGLFGAADLAWVPDGSAVTVLAWREQSEAETEDLWAAVKEAGALPADGPRTADVILTARLKYRYDGIGYTRDRRRHVARIALGGDGEAEWLTSGNFDVWAYAWHPGAGRLAVVQGVTGERDELWNTEVVEWTTKEGEFRPLCRLGGLISALSWSPRGDRLALVGEDERYGPATDPHLWLWDDERKTLQELLPDLDRPVGAGLLGDTVPMSRPSLAWDADGDGLALTIGDAGSVVPCHVRLSRPQAERLVPPDWVGNCAALEGGDGRWWAVMDDSDKPAELYRLTTKAAPERLTDIQTSLVAAWEPAPYQSIRFAGADGLLIEAFVVRPAESADPAPVMLLVHGGPHGQYGRTFSYEAQYHAAQGRVVVMVNPRGSSGYGQAFSRGCVNDWGGGDYQDIMAGVDAVIARGWGDPKRMAVGGISYGGYMTSWIITQTDRFACAVPEMLLADLTSMWGTSDIGWFLMEAEAGGSPLDGGEGLWKHSPLAYAHRCKTPALIIQGEEDFRCPMGQGEELYTALRRQGVEAVLVRLQGASHIAAFMGPPRLRLARRALIERWLARHGV